MATATATSTLRFILLAALFAAFEAVSLYSELTDDSDVSNSYWSPLPIEYIDPASLPDAFNWADIGITRSLNQHIPQYCGSCWAHAAISSLSDRIKIVLASRGDEINLSIQFVLNCGASAGSCHGGSSLKTFRFIRDEAGMIPYETCMPYMACSAESTNGFCPNFDTSCTKFNTCRTCDHSGTCREIDHVPNATVAEYGSYRASDYNNNSSSSSSKSSKDGMIHAIKAEIFARGPVGTALNGHGLSDYVGGIYANTTESKEHTHAVSIIGWGKDATTGMPYWIVRNSWSQAWGELGFFRILLGEDVLGIERTVTWATPGSFTTINYPCNENGSNCAPTAHHYLDPSRDLESVQRRLQLHKDQPVQS